MDSELVTSSESVEGDGHSVPFSNSYTTKFYEVFPFYLSIGMTPEQYREKIEKVTMEDVVAAAGTIKLHTRFFLEGVGA